MTKRLLRIFAASRQTRLITAAYKQNIVPLLKVPTKQDFVRILQEVQLNKFEYTVQEALMWVSCRIVRQTWSYRTVWTVRICKTIYILYHLGENICPRGTNRSRLRYKAYSTNYFILVDYEINFGSKTDLLEKNFFYGSRERAGQV